MATPEFYHDVGQTYIERIDKKTVRYKVAELVVRANDKLTDECEIIRTEKGNYIYCLPDQREHTLFATKDELMQWLADGATYETNRKFLEALGGKIEDYLPEV